MFVKLYIYHTGEGSLNRWSAASLCGVGVLGSTWIKVTLVRDGSSTYGFSRPSQRVRLVGRPGREIRLGE